MLRAILAGLMSLISISGSAAERSPVETPENRLPSSAVSGPANATYVLEDALVTLVDGRTEQQAVPGSTERIETTLLDMPAWGDLDGDGIEDAAVVLLHRTGGTGSFYYVAAAILQGASFKGTNAVFLGDRVVVQSMQIRDRVLRVKYADRPNKEAMAGTPTIQRTTLLTLREGRLVKVPAFDNSKKD
jgi:hypothetical protein